MAQPSATRRGTYWCNPVPNRSRSHAEQNVLLDIRGRQLTIVIVSLAYQIPDFRCLSLFYTRGWPVSAALQPVFGTPSVPKRKRSLPTMKRRRLAVSLALLSGLVFSSALRVFASAGDVIYRTFTSVEPMKQPSHSTLAPGGLAAWVVTPKSILSFSRSR